MDNGSGHGGGIISTGPELTYLEIDEHVVHKRDGVWVCVRTDHQRHVCHGNRFEIDGLSWHPRT